MPLFTHSPGDLDELVHLSWKSIRNLGGQTRGVGRGERGGECGGDRGGRF
jgi:hypothetical protein